MEENIETGEFWVNEEQSTGEKYFSVSGKFGMYEYHRIGHFLNKAKAEKYIEELKHGKK